ncbi:hypothetical protein PVAND_012642 [Polypedilum vanderplanki]|uniref:SCP domain-containing protein n=1 Tax=Polypedilum vanderplanki TaxID=319348 RepID=A0A9J6CN52_POLVA|nr:hypothetical protein PVAND_012642 [Polypedilum vanderplanki]
MINLWYSEHRNTRRQDIEDFSGSRNPINGEPIGNYTGLVNKFQTHVGCSLLHYNDSELRFNYFVCNYAFIDMEYRRVYHTGATASACFSYKNLILFLLTYAL